MGPTRATSNTCASMALTAALGLGALLPAAPAAAQEFVLHAEPAIAFWLDKPQSDRFHTGFYLAVRPSVTLGRVVSIQWSYAMLLAASRGDYTENGAGHFLTTGLRLRPLATLARPERQLGGLFVDFNLGYVRTGDENRFGFDTGLGYSAQVADWLALGPVVRYSQIIQADGVDNVNPHDAQFLTAGLGFSFGRAYRPEPVCPESPACEEQAVVTPKPVPVAVVTPKPVGCPDADRDGVCDADDRCPTRPGPAATLGCPVEPCSGAPLVVLVQFDQDSAGLPSPADDAELMDPVLDAVAGAIAQEPSCRVCIVGHASEEGPVEYNQDLSETRATAVQRYLGKRGLEASRLPAIGQGARCQLEPLSTRPLNRRVEFIRLDDGESCPTSCVE